MADNITAFIGKVLLVQVSHCGPQMMSWAACGLEQHVWEHWIKQRWD